MKTLKEKLAQQQGVLAGISAGTGAGMLPPGVLYIWYMGARAAVQILASEQSGGECRAASALDLVAAKLQTEITLAVDDLVENHGVRGS
jgi:hypothetical protein